MLVSIDSQHLRGQVSHRKTRSSLGPILLVSIVLVSAILTTCDCKSTDNEQRPTLSRVTSDLVNDALEQQLANAEPRQYFKVHVAPSQSKRKLPIKHVRGVTPASNQDEKLKELLSKTQKSQQSSNGEERPKSVISKQKINNATLKKLLSQSLLKQLNETAKSSGSSSSSSAKAPNFKFVFIQRATAPPGIQTNESTQINKKAHNSNRNGTSSSQYPASLAVSVSKQLASSLLYSAANFVGNLSSVPSLTSLASQIAQINQTDGKQLATNTISTSGSSSTSISPTSSSVVPTTLSLPAGDDQDDIRRIQTNTEVLPAKKSSSFSQNIGGNTKKSGSGVKSKPSKVYNLPVKFVSNGQPNHIVFNTIKQHFATIKKIQSVARLASQNQQGKRRKQAGQKVRGNSRLIYLPLKYLSNARPNRIISSKATHKSTS